jgi:Flp pilus assembly secretin CpaC
MTSPFSRNAARGLAAVVVLTATLGAGTPPSGALRPVTVAQFVAPQANVRFTELYRLHYLNAKSVADLLRRSFANIQVSIVSDVNGVTVIATAAQHSRIADALAQLDVPAGTAVQAAPSGPSTPTPIGAGAGGPIGVDVVTLQAAIPGINGAQSSSASDIAAAVTQALSASLPDLHITIYASQSQLLLTGSPNSIRIARELIDQLDALPKLVVLDVTIFEVDENVSKNLGLSLLPAVISTTYTETTPAAPVSGGTPPPLLGLQQLSRTPLSLGVQLNLLIQNGHAKVLADPKLTTLSGRTASIRAGDNIAILTTTGGSVGTVATTQLVTFNTGVQLEITPVINAGNFISVTLHPTVNNLSSVLNGVPQISTRDVQTTVALQEGQSLVIGGLIEDSINNSEQHIPILGYLPIVGPIFTQKTVTGERDELIIVVTPHVIDPHTVAPAVGPAMTEMPPAATFPALAPATVLPQLRAASPESTPAPTFIAFPSDTAPATANFPQAAPAPQSTPVNTSSSSNAFVYGQRPPAVPSAGPNDPPRVLYVLATPQVVKQGTTISIQAVTTPNVTRVQVQLGAAAIILHQAGAGLWDATVPFSMPNTAQMTQVPALLTASRADGVAATISIPLTVVP